MAGCYPLPPSTPTTDTHTYTFNFLELSKLSSTYNTILPTHLPPTSFFTTPLPSILISTFTLQPHSCYILYKIMRCEMMFLKILILTHYIFISWYQVTKKEQETTVEKKVEEDAGEILL